MSAQTNAPCKFTIYAADAKKLIGGTTSNTRDSLGHVFISLTDDKGMEHVFGYHALSFLYGPDNVPEKDAIRGYHHAFKPVGSTLRDDSDRHWDVKREWPISQDQYDRMMQLVQDWKAKPPPYVLVQNNCVTFAYAVARQGGIKMPPHPYFIPTPTGVVHTIKIAALHDRLRKKVEGAVKRVVDLFNDAGQRPHKGPTAGSPPAKRRAREPGLRMGR